MSLPFSLSPFWKDSISPLILSDLNLPSSHRWDRRKIPRNTRRAKRHGTVTFAAERISDGILFRTG